MKKLVQLLLLYQQTTDCKLLEKQQWRRKLTLPQSTLFNDDKQLIWQGSVRNKNFSSNISLAEA